MPGDTAGTPSRAGFSLRSLLLPVYLPTFLFAVGQSLVLPVIPLYIEDFGVSLGVVGLVVALQSVGTMGADVPAGIAASRRGSRMTLAAGAGGTALAAAGLGASPSVWPAAACVLMLGSAFALWQVARLSHIADTVPNAYRGRALALIGGTNRIGMFVGPFAGGLAAELVSLRATFFLQAAVAAVACVVVLLFMRDGVAAPRQHGPRAHTRVARTLVEHRRSFLTAGTAAICLVLVRYSRRLLFPLWGDHIGLGTGEIGLIFSAAFAIDMVMFPVVGVVMDRRGRRWTFVPCLLLFALSLALVPLTAGFASLLAVGLLSGFANGLGSGAVMTLGADLAPRQHSGEFLGVWRLITDTGAVAAPAVVGGLAELATLGTAAVATGGFGVVGAVVMLLLVRETLVREPP